MDKYLKMVKTKRSRKKNKKIMGGGEEHNMK